MDSLGWISQRIWHSHMLSPKRQQPKHPLQSINAPLYDYFIYPIRLSHQSGSKQSSPAMNRWCQSLLSYPVQLIVTTLFPTPPAPLAHQLSKSFIFITLRPHIYLLALLTAAVSALKPEDRLFHFTNCLSPHFARLLLFAHMSHWSVCSRFQFS